MPFKSQSQRGYIYIHHPELAKEFEEKTPKGKKLPHKVSDTEMAKHALKNMVK